MHVLPDSVSGEATLRARVSYGNRHRSACRTFYVCCGHLSRMFLLVWLWPTSCYSVKPFPECYANVFSGGRDLYWAPCCWVFQPLGALLHLVVSSFCDRRLGSELHVFLEDVPVRGRTFWGQFGMHWHQQHGLSWSGCFAQEVQTSPVCLNIQIQYCCDQSGHLLSTGSWQLAAPIVVGLALPGSTGPPVGATAGGAATGPSLWCFLRGSSRLREGTA